VVFASGETIDPGGSQTLSSYTNPRGLNCLTSEAQVDAAVAGRLPYGFG